MDDIRSAYPNEWVLIARPNDSRRSDVLGGWVLAHSTREDEVALAMDLMPIAHDLALVHADTDPELAKATADCVYTLEYLAWRPVFLDEPEVEIPPQPAPAPRRPWWRFW